MNNPTQYTQTTNPTYKQFKTLARDSQPLVIPYLDAIEKSCLLHAMNIKERLQSELI